MLSRVTPKLRQQRLCYTLCLRKVQSRPLYPYIFGTVTTRAVYAEGQHIYQVNPDGTLNVMSDPMGVRDPK